MSKQFERADGCERLPNSRDPANGLGGDGGTASSTGETMEKPTVDMQVPVGECIDLSSETEPERKMGSLRSPDRERIKKGIRKEHPEELRDQKCTQCRTYGHNNLREARTAK